MTTNTNVVLKLEYFSSFNKIKTYYTDGHQLIGPYLNNKKIIPDTMFLSLTFFIDPDNIQNIISEPVMCGLFDNNFDLKRSELLLIKNYPDIYKEILEKNEKPLPNYVEFVDIVSIESIRKSLEPQSTSL